MKLPLGKIVCPRAIWSPHSPAFSKFSMLHTFLFLLQLGDHDSLGVAETQENMADSSSGNQDPHMRPRLPGRCEESREHGHDLLRASPLRPSPSSLQVCPANNDPRMRPRLPRCGQVLQLHRAYLRQPRPVRGSVGVLSERPRTLQSAWSNGPSTARCSQDVTTHEHRAGGGPHVHTHVHTRSHTFTHVHARSRTFTHVHSRLHTFFYMM